MSRRCVLAVLIASVWADASNAQNLPQGDGRDIVKDVCSQSHDLTVAIQTGKTAEQWRHLVTTMMNLGARLEDYEIDTIVRYLAEHFGQKQTQRYVDEESNCCRTRQ